MELRGWMGLKRWMVLRGWMGCGGKGKRGHEERNRLALQEDDGRCLPTTHQRETAGWLDSLV